MIKSLVKLFGIGKARNPEPGPAPIAPAAISEAADLIGVVRPTATVREHASDTGATAQPVVAGDTVLTRDAMEATEADAALTWDDMSRQARASVDQGRDDDAVAVLHDAAARFPELPAPLKDLAAIAERRRDWPEAERCWRGFIALDDRPSWAHTALAASLREQGRIDEADAVLAAAQERLPRDLVVFVERARLADASRDWTEALRRWEEVRTRFPDAWPGFAGVATALRELGQFDDAQAVLTESVARFPRETGPLRDLGRLAERRRDWPEAERCWRAFIALGDRPSWAHTALSASLREQGRVDDAHAVLTAAVARFPRETGPLHDLGRLAERRRDWPEAERCWRAILVLDDRPSWAHAALSASLREQGRVEEAEAVLVAAQERLPGELAVFVDAARLAVTRRDWTEALRRWEEVRTRFPDAWLGFGGLATALRELGRLDEARAVLTEAAARFPGDAGPLHGLARLAERRRDWPEAERCWRASIALDERAWLARAGLALALREQGRAEEAEAAEACLAAAQERFPGEIQLFIEHARLAEARGDWPAALARWGTVSDRFDQVWQSQVGTATALYALGRHAESQRILSDVAQTAPLLGEPLLAVANAALRLDAFDAAIESIKRMRRLHGVDRKAVGHVVSVLQSRLAESDPERISELNASAPEFILDSNDTPGQLATVVSKSDTDVMMKFESLGGDFPGCEIGLVQRRYGAEPLSLLRWATTPIEKLNRAMESRLSGVGTEDQTELYVTEDGYYKTRDKLYYMDMNTFIHETYCSPDNALKKSLTRISYLKDKLISDLQSSQKIFVYRSCDDAYEENLVRQLKFQMRKFGENRLLYLRIANKKNGIGTVSMLDDDLAFGYVGRFNPYPNRELFLDGWVDVFRASLSVWDAQINPPA